MKQKKVVALFIWCCFLLNISAQTAVSGTVIDKETKEVLPFVNIIASPSGDGSSTDFDGNFQFKTYKKVTALSFTYLGYETYVYDVTMSSSTDVVIELNPAGIQIEETVVSGKRRKNKIPKDTLAISLQQFVVDNKENNRPKSFETYSYKEHNVIEFDYYKFKDKFTKRIVLRPFRVIYDYIDTTDVGARYLPVLIQEKFSEHYYSKDPKKEKEIILGQYLTGVKNISAMVILDDIFETFDLYDNIIIAGGKSFTSPFSNSGLVTYRYYLTDSIVEGGKTYYQLDFTPKSKQSIAFNGTSMIDKESYAIKSIEFSIPSQANINFISEFKVKQEFNQVEGDKWILEGESIQIALNPTGKKNGRSLLVKKNMKRGDILVDATIPSEVFLGEKLIYADSIKSRSRDWWVDNRITPLTPTEEGIIEMTDSIELTKAYRNINWLAYFASTAFIKTGPVEFGRFYQFLSWNNIEGLRPKMGLRTNKDFNENIQLWAYLAYGTKDKQYKSYFNTRIMLPRVNNNWHTLELTYKKDFTFLGQDYEDQQFSHDNGFLSILRTTPLEKIMLMETIKATHERQWVNGYTTKFTVGTNTFFAVDNVFEFDYVDEKGAPASYDKFNVTEIGFDQHIAIGQKFFENAFYRFESLSNNPILDLSYRAGLKNIAGGDFAYHKFEMNLRQRLSSKLGFTYYNINGGIILGDAPYPIMFIPIANQNFYFNSIAYSAMNEFEFAADKYASFWLEHHFDGAIFNRIPLVKKLKLRSLISAKALIGNAKQSNLDIISLPREMSVPENWYLEAGFGIENILQVMRVDFVWRVTQRDKPEINKFALKFSFSPSL